MICNDIEPSSRDNERKYLHPLTSYNPSVLGYLPQWCFVQVVNPSSYCTDISDFSVSVPRLDPFPLNAR